MRHRKHRRRLGRTGSHRQALGRHIVCALFEHGQIVTTVPKAKAFRSMAEKLITLAKKNTLARYRKALAELHNETIVHKLFHEVGPRFVNRPGGYTRILRLGSLRRIVKDDLKPAKRSHRARRLGDGAEQAIFELVDRPAPAKPDKKRKLAKATAK